MFATKHQFLYALIMLVGGFTFGIPTDFLTCFKYSKRKILAICGNVTHFTWLFLCYIGLKSYVMMPNVLIYMPISFLIGTFLEIKILSKTVAFFMQYIYNITNKQVIKLRKLIARLNLRRK